MSKNEGLEKEAQERLEKLLGKETAELSPEEIRAALAIARHYIQKQKRKGDSAAPQQ